MSPPPLYARGAFDAAVLLFLASHVPITLLVDGQALLPASLYAWGPAATLRWYLSWSHDPLMGAPPLWFKSIIAAELLLQVPFFVLATRACLDRSASSAWLRVPAVIYGAHTATTLVPILAIFAFGGEALTASQRAVLVAVYMPYLVMPLLILWRAAASPGELFGVSAMRAKSRKLS